MSDDDDPNQIMAFGLKKSITAKELAAKMRSKREIYNFLSVDVGIYVPAYGKFACLPTHQLFSYVSPDLCTFRLGSQLPI